MPNNKKTTTKSDSAKPVKAPAKPAKKTKATPAKAPAKKTKAAAAPPTKTPIQGITGPALERIIKRAGIIRKEAAVNPVLRDRLSERVGIIMEDIKVYLEHSDRRTVYTEDLQSALGVSGADSGRGSQRERQEDCLPSVVHLSWQGCRQASEGGG